MVEGWFFWAALSADFAALTAIFAKIGIEGVDSDLATLVRTVIIVFVLAAFVRVTGKWSDPFARPLKTWVFLGLSALATGAFWVCYFRAPQIGDASRVAPVGVFLIAAHNRYARAFEELVDRCGSTFSALWLVSVHTEPRPRVPLWEPLATSMDTDGIIRVEVSSGYLQRLDLPALLEPVFREHGVPPSRVSWIVSLHRPLVAPFRSRPVVRTMLALYSYMTHLALRDTDAWQLPPDRTVEVGVPRVL